MALFGFSRGAFAVRSILTVLARVGLLRADQLDADQRDRVAEAIRLARRPLWMGREKIETFVRDYSERPVLVRFVGVWDTVIRYGPFLAPVRTALELSRQTHFGLFDQRVPFFVGQFRHAIALDEARASFFPWRIEIQKGQPHEEVWFAGSHSDVGGGHADARLSQITLSWMAERAADAGVHFDKMPAVEEDSYLGEIYPSRSGYWRFLPSLARTVQESDLHELVERRMREKDYSPLATLPEGLGRRLVRE